MTSGANPILGRSPAAATAGREGARSCIGIIAHRQQTILGLVPRIYRRFQDQSPDWIGIRTALPMQALVDARDEPEHDDGGELRSLLSARDAAPCLPVGRLPSKRLG